MKARLEAERLFDAARKRALPAFPRTIGIVTSIDAAALRDVTAAFARRAPHVRLVVYPSLVQGGDAPAALVDALARAGQRAEVDLLIVCRGGGSLEDLWAFNDERVVRAIAGAPMPVISGVGHETDVTLADFAADVRAATPTAAAELAAPSREEAGRHLATLAALMQQRAEAWQDRQAERLDRIAMRLARPADALRARRHRVELLAQRLVAGARRVESRRATRLADLEAGLTRAVHAMVGKRIQRLDVLAARTQALDPQQVLARGYAWLCDPEGNAVVSVARLAPGDRLRAVLGDGSAGVEVLDVDAGRN
jgi:exodeoxyribonuclease VII large subunit